MATQVQLRRGTSPQHNSFTGASGEVTVNTTNKSVHVHDGSTQGGFELARADLSNTNSVSLSGLTTTSDLRVTNNFYVAGVSTFVGAVTFQGGTITLGDANTDNVVFTADVNSNIIPNTDNSYDLGSSSQQWRDLYVKRNSNFNNINATGVTTSTGGFVGTLTGNVAGNVTGNVSGNLTGNVSGDINSTGVSTISNLRATNINATGVTTSSGGFVGALTGNVTGNATGLSGNPNITVTNVTVNGVLSVGGTSVILNAQQLQINDRDITLGITTDAFGNNVANDITANHGGIAIASTVGTPIINIPTDGVNTDLPTYKQIMWVKQNHYSGLGTDAWIINYGVSIGNTATVQNGSRLTVGAGFTVYDSVVDLQNLKTTSLNVSEISTLSTVRLAAGDVTSTSTTTATTSATAIVSISASTYRSAVFQVQSVEGTKYNMTTINVLHDGTETYMTEFGTINQPVGVATFATDISGGSLRLLAYPASTNSTTFKVITTSMNV